MKVPLVWLSRITILSATPMVIQQAVAEQVALIFCLLARVFSVAVVFVLMFWLSDVDADFSRPVCGVSRYPVVIPSSWRVYDDLPAADHQPDLQSPQAISVSTSFSFPRQTRQPG